MKHSTNVLCHWFFVFISRKLDWIHMKWFQLYICHVVNAKLYVVGEGRGHGAYWIICKYISTFHFCVQSGVYLYICVPVYMITYCFYTNVLWGIILSRLMNWQSTLCLENFIRCTPPHVFLHGFCEFWRQCKINTLVSCQICYFSQNIFIY